jgi:calcineurin-like phosphoesterase family protein
MGKGSINLHGHSHGRLKPLPRQFDVVDVWDFRPISLAEILARKAIAGRLMTG